MSTKNWLVAALLTCAGTIVGCVNPAITRDARENKSGAELFADVDVAVNAAKAALAEKHLGKPWVETTERGVVVHGQLSGLVGAVYNTHGGRGAVTITRAFPNSKRLFISVTTRSRLEAERASVIDALKGYNYNDPKIAAEILERIQALLPQHNVEALRIEDERARLVYETERRRILAEQEEKKRQEEEKKRQEAAALAKLIAEAAAGSRLTCANELECRKAFALAQIFVNTKTDMKIQLATDTIVETYNPTDASKLGAKVIKTPGAGQSAEITLTVTCRECSDTQRLESYHLMKAFRPFVEERLK